MSNGIRDSHKHRRYAARRKAELLAQGYRYQTLALAGDVVDCLERVKVERGFSNRADAMNWLIRQAMQAGLIERMAVSNA
ncbi:hypothetical protein [Gluconacetobacter diazotrophicus]|jgi:hypothetical protein|uniref:hypothetical protein n=1 Tax=Gluconacetobacter diazotrophicus TaxID=33996 RepID=UPI00059C522F|nr:hypothetical protein [Gluconacetobacter diazotrophicus]